MPFHLRSWTCTTPDQPWRSLDPADSAPPVNSDTLSTLRITEDRHQAVLGFGGCFNELGWHALRQAKAAQRDALLDELFTDDGCAFSFCRVPIGANDYALSWYDHAPTPGDFALRDFNIERDERHLLPYLDAARQRRPDLCLFASPWSPPVWMKTHAAYNHGRLKNEDQTLAAYARYFQKFVETYRQRGVNVSQVHVQNEPGSDQKFPSCVMPATQMRDFIRDHLGPVFQADQSDCEVWAGTFEKGVTHGWDFHEELTYPHLAHAVLKDPAARRYVDGVGLQWDGKGLIESLHRAFPELPIIQTENECGDGQNTWPYAFYVFSLACHYFNHGAVAYTYWNMALPQGGQSTWGWRQNAMASVHPDGSIVRNPEFYVMKHLAHFVRPGSRRRGLVGSWCPFALAFDTPQNETVAIIANPYDAPEPLALDNAPRLTLPPRSLSTFTFGT
ncbi:MAG: glycosyl hydrolase [Planctomycetota bacterium]